MRMASFWAGIAMLCLAVPAAAQQDDSPQNQRSQANQQQQEAANQNQDRQQRTQQQQQQQQIQEASLDEGETISLPAGGEVLNVTIAVPEQVHSGQRYRLRARVENTSDNIMLTNVKLMQTEGSQIDVESSNLESDAQMTTDQQNQQRRQQQQGQQQQGQQQQGQQQQGQQDQQDQQQNAQVRAAGEQSDDQQNDRQQQASGQDGSWDLGKLKPGQSSVLTITAVARETGDLEHCFSVKYDQSICTTMKVIKPEIEIAKSGPDQVNVCEPFEYRYELTNTGTGPAEDFVIRDDLPEGVRTETGEDSLEFRVPRLNEGETKAFVASVHAMKEGEYASRARVEQNTGQSHESERVSTEVVAPELQVSLNGPRMMKADDSGNFNATVKNTSDVRAQNVELMIRPDENLQVTNAGQGDAREGGKAYRYSIGDLDPQEEQTVSVSIDAAEQGNYQIEAVAHSLCGFDDEMKVAEATTSLSTEVKTITSLAITLVDLDDVIPTGDQITYRVRVKNQGSNADKNVKVDLELPEGLTFENANGPEKPESNGQQVTLGPVDELAAGDMLEWTITTSTESAGEKLVKASLTSEELEQPVESEEISTIFDADQRATSQSQAQGRSQDSSDDNDTSDDSDDESDNQQQDN